MGAPGWPELAFPGMSTAKQRMVLMHFQSSSEYAEFDILRYITRRKSIRMKRRNILFRVCGYD